MYRSIEVLSRIAQNEKRNLLHKEWGVTCHKIINKGEKGQWLKSSCRISSIEQVVLGLVDLDIAILPGNI